MGVQRLCRGRRRPRLDPRGPEQMVNERRRDNRTTVDPMRLPTVQRPSGSMLLPCHKVPQHNHGYAVAAGAYQRRHQACLFSLSDHALTALCGNIQQLLNISFLFNCCAGGHPSFGYFCFFFFCSLFHFGLGLRPQKWGVSERRFIPITCVELEHGVRVAVPVTRHRGCSTERPWTPDPVTPVSPKKRPLLQI